MPSRPSNSDSNRLRRAQRMRTREQHIRPHTHTHTNTKMRWNYSQHWRFTNCTKIAARRKKNKNMRRIAVTTATRGDQLSECVSVVREHLIVDAIDSLAVYSFRHQFAIISFFLLLSSPQYPWLVCVFVCAAFVFRVSLLLLEIASRSNGRGNNKASAVFRMWYRLVPCSSRAQCTTMN